MEPLSLRSAAITDPSMRPILDWIDSYVSWEKLPEETRRDLATRAHAGDEKALEALVNHNLRLVLSRAVKRLGRGMPLGDLVQEGWIGLRTAAGRFDPTRRTRTTGQPVKFSTMATRWIDRALRNAIVEQGRAIRLPHYAVEFLTRMRMRLITGEPMRLDDQVQLDGLARELTGNPHLRNVTLDYVKQILDGPASLDKPIAHTSHGGAETEHTLADYIAAPAQPDPSDLLDLEALLLELVNNGTLSRREGWLICRHYGLDGEGGRTYLQMAREMAEAATRAGNPKGAVSRQRIEQLMRPAMRTLRQYVLTHGEQLGDSTLAIVYSHTDKAKGSQVPLSPAKVKSTESPKKTARRTPDDSSKTTASQVAAPLPLRAHSSTKRGKRSSTAIPGGTRTSDTALGA